MRNGVARRSGRGVERRLPRALVVLLGVAATGGSLAAQPSPGAVVGTAFDSVAAAPLAHALVQLATEPGASSRRAYGTRADAAGRFRLEAVAPGTYLAAVAHPALDALGLEAPVRRVTVAAGATASVDLGLPGARTLVRQLCPAAVDEGSALLLGFVRDAAGVGRGGAVVTLAWSEVELASGVVDARRVVASVRAAPGGWYSVCNPPTGVELLARAEDGEAASGDFPLELAAGAVARRDIVVGARGASDGALRGTVHADGAPVAGALVSVAGAAARAETDAAGAFALAGLPAGTRTLDVRAIGYLPARVAVDVRPAAEVDEPVRVALHDRARFLDTVRVTAARLRDPELDGFAERRRRGFGHFLDRAALERRNAILVSDALIALPGVITVDGAGTATIGGGRLLGMRGSNGDLCIPTVWIDGHRLSGEDLDWYTLARHVAGIEVYTRDGQAPPRFQDLYGCGSIVVWTERP